MSQALALWTDTMAKFGIAPKDWSDQWKMLLSLYEEPTRFYHTITHIDKMAEAMRHFSPDAPDAMRFAILYHDSIYETRRQDNEEQSAALALTVLDHFGLSAELQTQTSDLILCTKTHQMLSTNLADVSGTFLDLDLLILGTPPEVYADYSKKIRQEYEWVPEPQYRSGRAKVLHSFLDRKKIFFSEEIRDTFENRARANLQSELVELESSN